MGIRIANVYGRNLNISKSPTTINMATSTEIKKFLSPSECARIAAIDVMKKPEEPSPPSMSDIQAMMEELKRLKMENEEFKKRQRPVTFCVNEKGAVSMFGLGKYPVTLYKIQWERIMAHIDPLKEFIKDNEHKLN